MDEKGKKNERSGHQTTSALLLRGSLQLMEMECGLACGLKDGSLLKTTSGSLKNFSMDGSFPLASFSSEQVLHTRTSRLFKDGSPGF